MNTGIFENHYGWINFGNEITKIALRHKNPNNYLTSLINNTKIPVLVFVIYIVMFYMEELKTIKFKKLIKRLEKAGFYKFINS